MKESKYYEVKAEILSFKEECEGIVSCVVRSGEIARKSLPGQFITIQVNRDNDNTPVLRRPFAISHINDDTFEFIFDIVGKGTEFLYKIIKTEKYINILGPLGNGFYLEDSSNEKLLIAGGIGIAPIKRLAKYFSDNKCKTTLIWGNRDKTGFFDIEFYKDLNLNVLNSTDDGSMGFKGNVLQILKSEIQNKNIINLSDYDIFVVGPNPMMKAVSDFIEEIGHTCQVSLETPMACGIGVCQGCAVRKKDGDGYQLVCKDGPVFYSNKIIIN